MSKSIFITGSGGFIGSAFLRHSDLSQYEQIFCLTRNMDKFRKNIVGLDHVHVIEGDIRETEKYASCLAECDTIVHFAAATGKAISKETYFKVNTQGTEILLEQGKRVGVEKFLHISTIAVKYPDISKYYYAQSKVHAENSVIRSGLNYAIVRPTIVIGEGSPVWDNLLKLAKLPISPLFGNGSNRVQPIFVNDLIDCLSFIVQNNYFENSILEVGGPQIVTFAELIGEIRYSLVNKKIRFIKFPYRPVVKVLSGLESSLHKVLPITAGQLSAFVNDGTIQENRVFNLHKSSMKNVQEMVETIFENQKADATDLGIQNECLVYTRFLIHQEPSRYIIDKYRQAHLNVAAFQRQPRNNFEKFIVIFSSKSPTHAILADAYASMFMKSSLFRKKMVLLLAILESSALSSGAFEQPDSANVLIIFLRLGINGFRYVVSLLVALFIFLPIRLWFAIFNKSNREEK